MLVDSHCHLDYLDDEIEKIREEANKLGVMRFLTIGVTEKHWPELLAFGVSDDIDVSLGIHPCDIQKAAAGWEDRLLDLAKNESVVALGETGLDYFHDQSFKLLQQQAFESHIAIATALKKPLVVHMRDAKEDTIDWIRRYAKGNVRGVMHCFTEDWEVAKQALDCGFMISFSGIVTFKNAQTVQEVASKVPLDQMLVETDSPYLAPVPYRGKTNQPAYVHYVAKKIAELKGLEWEEVANQTTANYKSLFLS